MPPAVPSFARSPQELAARLIETYREGYRRAGKIVTDEAIANQVIADLEMVDGARRAGEVGDGLPPSPEQAAAARAARSSRPDPVAAAASAAGLRLAGDRAPDPEARPYRPNVLYRNPAKLAERFGYAVKRMERILEGSGGSSSLLDATSNATVPKLAREFLEVWGFFTTRDRPLPLDGKDHNPFRGLSDRDASRMFMRKIEDLADRSTGVLGSWYVK